MSETPRQIEIELEIDAEPEAVWRALTEADELMRWFPPMAEVVPGPGGRIRLAWGEDLCGDCNVKVWEPGKRLKTSWWEPPGAPVEPGRALDADSLIEGKGGGTVLRLLHSGFGSDESWDDEYDSIRRGWNFELRSLRHYLEQHRGQARNLAFERIPVGGDPHRAWGRLVGQDGLFRTAVVGALAEGVRFDLQLPGGESSPATLVYQLADKDFAVILQTLGDGILRLGLETFTAQPELWVWLASWTLGGEQLEGMLGTWRQKITAAISNRAVA